MPVREIKTSLALDGEKAFKQAIADASRQLRVMNADLKAVAAEFDLTGDKEQMLTQKSGILKTEISQQEKIVEALNRAVQESAEAFGDSSNKTDGYRIKLSNAKASLSKLKSELQDADREAEEFGRDSVKVGRQIEDGIGDSAEDAEKSVKGLVEKLSEDISSIKGSASIAISTRVIGAITDAASGLMGFVEENQDYRRRMAKFSEAVKQSGLEETVAQDFMHQIAAVTGDIEGAITATSNLLRSGLDQSGIQNAIDNFLGAGILFGDTFNIESLAEDYQESVKTGEATGIYAELLTRIGEDVQSYNELMKNEDELTRANGSLTILSDHGLKESKDSFVETYQGLIDATQAQMELDQSWADLAEQIEPLVTSIISVFTDIVDSVNTQLEGVDKEKIINVIERFGELIGQAIEIIGPIAIDLIDMGADLAMPVFDVIEDIFNLIGDFIDDLGSEGFSEAINNLGENILESLPDEVKQVIETLSSIVSDIITGITSVITFISDAISGLAKDFGVFAEYAGKSDELPLTEEQKQILENEKNWVDSPTVGGPAGTGFLESFGMGLWELTKSNLEKLYQKSEGSATTPLPSLFEDQNLEVTITPTPTEDPEVNEAFEGLGASNGASYDQGLNAAMSSAIENAKISGVNVGVSISNGITEATPGAVAAANALVDSVNAALSGLTGGINLGVGSYTAGNLTANINMDGRRVGQYISPIISNYLGQSASRTQKIG